MPKEVPTVYLTTEQLQRLAALSLDALHGCQLHTDADDRSVVYGEFVRIDDPNQMDHFEIDADGTYRNTT